MNEESRRPELIMRLGMAFASKEDAIREACALLFAAGCVDRDYARSMLRREETANTWLGAGLAIPHGALEDKGGVKRDGLAVLQSPAGVDWGGGNRATLIVAIAAAGDGHIAILKRMTGLLQDQSRMSRLSQTLDEAELKAAFLERTEEEEEGKALPDFAVAREWVLDYPAGLHARPALIWSESARESTALLRVRHERKSADPRQLVALLHLGLKAGDRLTVSADGPGAGPALERFLQIIASLSAAEKEQAARARAAQEPVASAAKPSWAGNANADGIAGAAAAPGFCLGNVFSIRPGDIEVPDIPMSLDRGAALLADAVSKARQQIRAVMDDTGRRLGVAEAAIFKTHDAFLEDRELIAACAFHMVNGHGPAWSWNSAVEELARSFEAMDNAVLAARAADIRDAGRRVLGFLLPENAARKRRELPAGKAVLLAKDLSPADMAEIDPGRVLGIVTVFGSPTSHMAILARTLGIPTVVACGAEILDLADGEPVIVDGDGGVIYRHPSPEVLAAAGRERDRRESRRKEQIRTRALPATTTDGRRFTISANINNADQVPSALDMGAEGVGLMRTEFLFLERGESPGEDDQAAAYIAMAKALDGRGLTIRALDIGGDKQMPRLALEKEENPFLGVRGARLLLRRRDLLLPQLRAIYRSARECANIRLMFPMISNLDELRELRKICEEVRRALDAPPISLGIMIEVPAAAILAEVLAREVDFFSIGTNDLTQYTLAMDRQNPALARETDGVHPAVLRLIKTAVDGARKHRRHVGVCGGIAGEKTGALLLSGMGVDELSMTPHDIPAVKEALRAQEYGKLKEMTDRAFSLASPEEVHALLESS
ncbi:MAG: phosphoenolpyruvate--protein phosphotransferase [Candidatus Accumulibacter sp.]|jgi:phosphocarrier protein FPr|nr:phosphoenolpyruvate--protein phosphotransferase [Accumulibacter sp.]